MKPYHLTEQEKHRITAAFTIGRGDKGCTTEELDEVWHRCTEWKIQHGLLNLICGGELMIDWDGSDIIVISPDKSQELRKKYDYQGILKALNDQ